MQYLITGGAGFIGSNYAFRLLKRGEQVTLYDNLSRRGAQANLQWLASTYGEDAFRFVQGDVRDPALLTAAAYEADVIVHLAAQVAVTTSVEQPRRDIEINALGTFLCCRQAVPLMTEGGAILNISSILGFNTLKNCTMYAASKGGVEGFSRALAVDLAQKGIRVNVLRPGMVNVERDTVSPDDPLYDEICARILAGRPGTVEDMAPMAVLLCSEDAGFITGQTICADGGQNVLLSAPFAMGFSSPEGDLKDLPDH